MDPRLYTFQRRTPRLNNPTFKSEFVTDSLLIFKGGPLGSSSLKNEYISHIDTQKGSRTLSLSYNPSEISKIRASFENNRSKVPLSNLSIYAREIMFPTQKQPNFGINQGNLETIKPADPQTFIKPELYFDNKEKNYIKTICKMNDQYLSKSRMGEISDKISKNAAGKPSFIYDDKDKRYYRYKHSYDSEMIMKSTEKERSQSLHKSYVPSRLNYADELKGIL